MCKKRSEVAGKLTRNVQVNNCDVDFICDTGANVSILIETTTDMLDLQLKNPTAN